MRAGRSCSRPAGRRPCQSRRGARHRRLAGGCRLLRAHARGHGLAGRPVRVEPARHECGRRTRSRPAPARRTGRAAHRHLLGTDGTEVLAADDLNDCLAVGDQAIRDICTAIERTAAELGLRQPELPPPPSSNPVAAPASRLADLGVVIVACGFRPAYEWIEIPDVVDEMGFPVQQGGASTRVLGLHFVGVPWMRTRKSPLLLGVGEDAGLVVERLAQ
jgi:hypothetical protein